MRPRHRILFKHHALRTAFLLGAFVAGIFLLRAAWSLLANARLHLAERNVAASLPQPFPSDPAATRPAPDSPANALLTLAQHFQPATFRTFGMGNQTNLPFFLEANWTDDERQNVRNMLSANADLLRRLDEAAPPPSLGSISTPVPAWYTPLDTLLPGLDVTLNDRIRLIQDLCIVAAVMAHAEHRHEEALAHLERLFALDRVLLAHPSLAAHNLAMLNRARTVAVLERIAPAVEFATPGAPPATQPASPAAARRLIATLLDSTHFRAQLAQAHAFQVAALCGRPVPFDERPILLRQGNLDATSWFLRPVLVDERRRAVAASARWQAATRADNYDFARQAPFLPSDFRLARVASSASNSFNVQWSRIAFSHFRAITDAHAAAVFLAARLATLDRGSPPLTAERLVPAYLPSPPVDPFAADARPLRYHLDPDGVTVWSVGADGIDDGASVSRVVRGRTPDQPDLVYGAGWRNVLLGIAAGTSAAATGPATAPRP